MPEHLIRLRGGWLLLDPAAIPLPLATASGLRVTLPITWPEQAGSVQAFRLIRSFGLPPLDPATECLALCLDEVDGLVAAHLNGQEIVRPALGLSAMEVALPLPLPPRNRLVLEVEVAPADNRPERPSRPWGAIALVIRSQETPPGAGPTGDLVEETGNTPTGDGDDVLGGTRSRA